MKKTALCLLIASLAGFLSAQSAVIDSSFGVNGQVKTKLFDFSANPYGQNLVMLPSGEPVAAGVIAVFPPLLAVYKFKNNGDTDSSFTRIFPNLGSELFGLSEQFDGKLLVTSESHSNYVGSVSRLNADGSQDTTFGASGTVLLAVKPLDNILPIGTLDGKIVVFGEEDIPDSGTGMFVARVHSDGTIDTTFAFGGYFRFKLSTKYVFLLTGLEQPGGKLLFAGSLNGVLFLIRLNPNGTKDLSFGIDGFLVDPTPVAGEAYDLALQPDGKIVVCGYGYPSFRPIVARYHDDGSRDMTFGDQGVAYFTDMPEYTEGIGIEVLPNGKILVGVSSYYGENFYLAQLLPSGALDTTFGENGILTHLTEDFRARAMRIAGNKVVASGKGNSTPNDRKIFLLRFLLDLNVGTLNPHELPDPNLWIYPNPVAEYFSLKFELTEKLPLSIRLYDLNGKLVQTFRENQLFEPGAQEITLHCPTSLPARNYVLALDIAGERRLGVQICKR